MSGIGSILKNYGVQMESKALDTFGAAVGNYAKQAGLGPLADIAQQSIRNKGLTVNSIGGVASALGIQGIDGLLGTNPGWQSSKYAADLVAFAPKHRFIFKVKFIFNPPYANHINREFMYLVKDIDKPKVTFDYQDVNMYNFKTKVLTSITHEPLSMTFIDDIQNKVLDFFNAYRVAHSPVASLTYEQKAMMENAGMDFYQPGSGGLSSASMGILADGQKNILSHIEVVQVYAHGTRQNVFIFTNPKIENFDFDNLSHEGGDGNSMAVRFAYDALYVYDTATVGTPSPAWGTSDILGNQEVGAATPFGNSQMGDSSIFGGISKSIGGVLDAIGKPISAVTSAFGSILNTATGAVGKVVSSATSELTYLRDNVVKTTMNRVDSMLDVSGTKKAVATIGQESFKIADSFKKLF